MKQIKQWHLSLFDENDLEYIRGLECDYEINNAVKTIEVNAPNGQKYLIADRTANYGLYITTDDKKKESMLMLKYSGNITLLRIFYADEWTRYEF